MKLIVTMRAVLITTALLPPVGMSDQMRKIATGNTGYPS